MDALAKLSAATTALAEARTLDEVKHILDLAEAARTYARAAKLGLEAQNHAAEIKLRAERKAGELLADLERAPHNRGNQHAAKFQDGIQPESEYRTVLTESDIAPTTAHRWQVVAALPEELFEEHIAETTGNGQELTSAGVAQVAQGWKRQQSEPHEWTPDQVERRDKVLDGETVVANQKKDHALIAWAKENNFFVAIDRSTVWGNPFLLPGDGDRDTVIKHYEWYLGLKPSLLNIVDGLEGKVLGCWCYPECCHGDVLSDYAMGRK